MIAQRDDASDIQKARIRDKVATGLLPRALGAFALRAPMRVAEGNPAAASGTRCDACDEPGPARAFAGLRWHDACFSFWQATTAQIDG
jgi:hypothetical protein